MRSTSFLLLFLFMSSFLEIRSTPHIDWCLYWRYLNKDQFRPECNGVYRLRFAKHKVFDQKLQPKQQIVQQHRLSSLQSTIPSPSTWNGFAQCGMSYTNCHRSTTCNTGHMCVDSTGYCCGIPPPLTRCPAPETLAFNCQPRRQYINWCNYDFECAPHLALRNNLHYNNEVGYRSSASFCCPTQCGYNMCVR